MQTLGQELTLWASDFISLSFKQVFEGLQKHYRTVKKYINCKEKVISLISRVK